MSLIGIKTRNRPIIVAIGLFAAALIYGDGAVTPAISVLSAMEGLKHGDAGGSALCAAGRSGHVLRLLDVHPQSPPIVTRWTRDGSSPRRRLASG